MDLVAKEELNIKETKDSMLILNNCILNIVKNTFSELLIYSLSAVHPEKNPCQLLLQIWKTDFQNLHYNKNKLILFPW